MTISYDDFQKLDLRVAKIVNVEEIPGKSGGEGSERRNIPLTHMGNGCIRYTYEGGFKKTLRSTISWGLDTLPRVFFENHRKPMLDSFESD